MSGSMPSVAPMRARRCGRPLSPSPWVSSRAWQSVMSPPSSSVTAPASRAWPTSSPGTPTATGISSWQRMPIPLASALPKRSPASARPGTPRAPWRYVRRRASVRL